MAQTLTKTFEIPLGWQFKSATNNLHGQCHRNLLAAARCSRPTKFFRPFAPVVENKEVQFTKLDSPSTPPCPLTPSKQSKNKSEEQPSHAIASWVSWSHVQPKRTKWESDNVGNVRCGF
jgi:hypothetical protein